MADQNTKAEKQERPNKDEIKGLPAHAQYQFRQGTWYVYFPYCFREDGKRKQERDYIGTLSPDGKEFLPNLYYVQNEPDFDHRPVERWKSPVMRQRALEKLNANKVETIAPGVSPAPELDCDQQLSVGASILNEDPEAIAAKAEEVVLTTNTSKMIVMLETSALKRKDKWKVKMGEQTSVFVSVDDQAFVEKVEKGLEPIGRGDFLYVDLKMRQTLSDGKLHVLYAIKKVHDHKRFADKLQLV